MYPWFVQALQDKTLLLASNGEWDQALDTAQRLLDVDHDNLDALQVLFFYFSSNKQISKKLKFKKKGDSSAWIYSRKSNT
jgi:hypothetical protein